MFDGRLPWTLTTTIPKKDLDRYVILTSANASSIASSAKDVLKKCGFRASDDKSQLAVLPAGAQLLKVAGKYYRSSVHLISRTEGSFPAPSSPRRRDNRAKGPEGDRMVQALQV